MSYVLKKMHVYVYKVSHCNKYSVSACFKCNFFIKVKLKTRWHNHPGQLS